MVSFYIQPVSISMIIPFLLLSLFIHSTFSTPIQFRTLHQRQEGLPKIAAMMRPKEGGDGCTYNQVLYIQAVIHTASLWSSEAAKVFSNPKVEELRKFSGVHKLLSPDETSPTNKAFLGDVKPAEYNTTNDIKRDASMHLGNVASSFGQSIEKLTMPLSYALGEEAPHPGTFMLICASDEPKTKLTEDKCDDGYSAVALTNTYYERMILCPKFFKRFNMHNNDMNVIFSDLTKEIDDDVRIYHEVTKDGSDEPHPKNAVTTLLHEAQHSHSLLQSSSMHDTSVDIPNGLTPYPAQCYKIRDEDRSRSAESWALISWFIYIDRNKFVNKIA